MTVPGNPTLPEPTLEEASVAVILALPKEWMSARKIFVDQESDLYRKPGQLFSYDVCRIPSSDKGYNVVALVLLPDFGTAQAAAYTAHLLGQCKDIKEVVVCGIGGAISDPSSDSRDIRLGDIVYMGPTGVVQHDNIRDIIEKTGDTKKYATELRLRGRTASVRMAKIARELEGLQSDGKYPWVDRISQLSRDVQQKFERPKTAQDILHARPNAPGDEPVAMDRTPRTQTQPRAFPGGIASGNRLLKNPEYRDELRGVRFQSLDLKCVEMEGAGVAEAAFLHEKGCFIVRGISDYCDEHKNDDWHNYAAGNAAAYVYCLVSRLQDLRTVKTPPQPVGAGPDRAISSVAASEPAADPRATSTIPSHLLQEAPSESLKPGSLELGAVVYVAPEMRGPATPGSPASYADFMATLTAQYQRHEWDAYYKCAEDFEAWISTNGAALSLEDLATGKHAVATAYLRLLEIPGFDRAELLRRAGVLRQQVKELANG